MVVDLPVPDLSVPPSLSPILPLIRQPGLARAFRASATFFPPPAPIIQAATTLASLSALGRFLAD